MNIVSLTMNNIAEENICCAMSNSKGIQVSSKKKWLSDRFDDGLMFLKSDIRGKCFIEYIPAEHAWLPIEANGYMHIDCLWVSGQLKGHGYSTELMNACIDDSISKGKLGLCAISSKKKTPFLCDQSYLEHKGFKLADTAEPHFTLMYKPFSGDAVIPRFAPHVKSPSTDDIGFSLYYTHGYPYTAKYAPIIEDIANAKGLPFKRIHINSLEMAKNAPAAWTTYALFYNGKFITNEIQSDKKFIALADKLSK